MFETGRAVFICVCPLESWWSYIHLKFRVVARYVIGDYRIELTAIKELESRREFRSSRIQSWISGIECKLLRIERWDIRIHAACVICFSKTQAGSYRHSCDGGQWDGNFRLKVKSLYRCRGNEGHI